MSKTVHIHFNGCYDACPYYERSKYIGDGKHIKFCHYEQQPIFACECGEDKFPDWCSLKEAEEE